MGMPITTYNVLNALSKRSPESYEIGPAQKALEPFNLFAFIIHDPAKHSDFNRKISSAFHRLDHSTGHHLLFFALVDPPERWLQDTELGGGRTIRNYLILIMQLPLLIRV